MTIISNFLKDIRSTTERHGLSILLYENTKIELELDELGDLRVDCISPLFAEVMKQAFSRKSEKFASVRPRVMGHDQKGILATALVGINSKSETLCSGGVEIDFGKFEQLLKITKSPDQLKQALFGGELTFFLSSIESLWVYLFLSFEEGLSVPAIVKNLNHILDNKFKGLRPWYLKTPPGETIIALFRSEYDDVCRS